MSPHLTIYRFRLNAITSIFFRGTGVAMSVGRLRSPNPAFTLPPILPQLLLLFCSGALGFGTLHALGLIDSSTFPEAVSNCMLAPIVKFGIAFPLIYHWIGGLRHIVRL